MTPFTGDLLGVGGEGKGCDTVACDFKSADELREPSFGLDVILFKKDIRDFLPGLPEDPCRESDRTSTLRLLG